MENKTPTPTPDPQSPTPTFLSIARDLLEQPTAAMKEDLPRRAIQAFVKARPGLTLSEDAAGNLLVRYDPPGAAAQPPLVLVAHLDHPSFWIDAVENGLARLTFKGYVLTSYVHAGLRVRFYERHTKDPVGTGEIVSFKGEGEDGAAPVAQRLPGEIEPERRLALAEARVLEGRAPADGFAMWDFPAFSIADGKIVTRCCDDLLGAAAALCTLDSIAGMKAQSAPLWGLFTRAEEIGFLGALEAIRHQTIPLNSRVLSLECSKAFEHAPQGGGVIIRVGDRSSIFNPQLTAALCQSAEQLKKADPAFTFQRKLMDGGSCEATAFCAHGYIASGVAVPLGNYHNQAILPDGKKTIGPESVAVSDFLGEVRLLTELAQHPEWLDTTNVKIPKSLLERAEVAKELSGKYVVKLQ
jgi:putative aminopeptidase FrvX